MKLALQKYLQVFKVSCSQEFAYKANFLRWRVRNMIKFFLIFFIWNSAFVNNTELFGYDKTKILTYVFGLVFVNAIVLSTRAVDVAGDISRGDIMNLLLRPVNFFKYWLTRDLSSKVLNLSFGVVEFIILYLYIKPPIYVQTNPWLIFLFIASLILGTYLYFLIAMMTSFIPFWMPEAGWGAHFLITAIFVQFLSGSMFPLDMFPAFVQNMLYLTPFPYLIFSPLQIYLGKIDGSQLAAFLLVPIAWAILMTFLLKIFWDRGLKAYEAYGR